MNDIEAVKSRVNIIDIVSEHVRLKKSGNNYFGLCPFHNEKTPSFTVNEEIQIYKCFGCGEYGDVYSYLMKTENISFSEALHILADKVGYKLTNKESLGNQADQEVEKLYEINKKAAVFYYNQLTRTHSEGQNYAKKRNITDDLIKLFGVGYASQSYQNLYNYLVQSRFESHLILNSGLCVEKEGKIQDKFRNRLMFSIFDERGHIVGFSGRYFGKDNPNFKPPKYLNSPETLIFKKSRVLFGLFQAKEAIKKLNFVILSEGQMNIISSHRVGVENIVASLGTSFTPYHLKLLKRYTNNIYLAFDKDTAGKKALYRTLEMMFKEDVSVKVIHWDKVHGKDPDELINFNQKLWLEAVRNPVDPIEYLYSEFEKKYKTLDSDNISSFLKAVLQLLRSHSNEVKKEFYVKYLAEKLGISEAAILEVLRKGQSSQNFQLKKDELEKSSHLKNDQTVTIYDKIFALILQNWRDVKHLVLTLEREYMPDKYKDLYDCLFLFTDTDSLQDIRESLDIEMQKLFDTLLLLYLMQDEHISTEEHIMKLIPISKNEYKKIIVQELQNNPDDSKLLDEINKLLKNGS